MSYYGQYPFNTNGGALLSKRNYINRKIDEIEQKLLQLGWIEPEQEIYESTTDEYDIPVESAGALLPYRDKVNKRLDFFEEVIQSHTSYNNPYNGYYNNSYNDSYNNSYNQLSNYSQPTYNNSYNQQSQNTNSQPKITQNTNTQKQVKDSFNDAMSNIFG